MLSQSRKCVWVLTSMPIGLPMGTFREQWLPVYKEFLAARDELTAAARRLCAAIDPTEFAQLYERGDMLALDRSRARAQKADSRQLSGLLSARCERPRRRAAECGQQFPSSDGDYHTPLPCEVRRGNDTTPRARCPSAHGAGGAHAGRGLERGQPHDWRRAMTSEPTGNTAELLNNVGVKNTAAINVISSTIGAVADVAGVTSAVIAVVNLFLPQPDPLAPILTAIENDFAQLSAALKARQNETLLNRSAMRKVF